MDNIVEGDVGRTLEFEGKEYFVAESIFDEPEFKMPMPKFEFNYPARGHYSITVLNPNFLHGLNSV